MSKQVGHRNLRGRLPMLPTTVMLPGQREAIVDHIADKQVTSTFEMIVCYASQGIGFTMDECLDENEFRDDMSYGAGFVVTDAISGKLLASFFVIESRFCRDAQAAETLIVVEPSERGKGIGRTCLKLSIEVAKLYKFYGVYYDILTDNKCMLKLVNGLKGVIRVGGLPYVGRDAGSDIIGSELFFLDLNKGNQDNDPSLLNIT